MIRHSQRRSFSLAPDEAFISAFDGGRVVEEIVGKSLSPCPTTMPCGREGAVMPLFWPWLALYKSTKLSTKLFRRIKKPLKIRGF